MLCQWRHEKFFRMLLAIYEVDYRSLEISLDTELWFSPCSYLDQTVERAVEFEVIWYVMWLWCWQYYEHGVSKGWLYDALHM